MVPTLPTTEKAEFRLSEEERRHYGDQGYVIVRDILTPEHIGRIKARAREFALGDLPEGSEKMVVRDVRVAKGTLKVDDPEKGLWKFMFPDRYDELFREYASTPRLLDAAQSLLGPDLVAFLTMMIYKPPGVVEAVHNYHQDAYYFPFGPHDQVMGTWVALDRVDADNGTLRVIPRSHKLGLVKHVTPQGAEINAGVYGVEGYDEHPDEVVVELEPGDGVFFHSHLLHKTGGNSTQRHRRVMTVHMAAARCKWINQPIHYFNMRHVRGQTYEGCV